MARRLKFRMMILKKSGYKIDLQPRQNAGVFSLSLIVRILSLITTNIIRSHRDRISMIRDFVVIRNEN
jgi:hypothetical protein